MNKKVVSDYIRSKTKKNSKVAILLEAYMNQKPHTSVGEKEKKKKQSPKEEERE